MQKIIFILLAFAFLLVGCQKEEFGPQCKNCDDIPLTASSSNDVIIINEGNFGFGNAEISLYSPINQSVSNSIFQQANGHPLGDVAQSAKYFDNKIYVVVNNSGKVEVLNSSTFQSVATITGFDSPREILFINENEAYVSNLFSNKIDVINLQTNTISNSIVTSSNWTEKMLLMSDTAYVCDVSNNQLLLIDIQTHQVKRTIPLGIQPNSMVIDKNNHLWILCDGGFNEDYAKLIQFQPNTGQIINTFIFSDINDSPGDLVIDNYGENLYFINQHIYKMNITSQQLPTVFWLSNNGAVFYSMGIHPVTNELFISDAKDFVQNSSVSIFNENAQFINTFDVGINAGDFVFLP